MNEEEKKVEKQEQLFDLGNGRFVDKNKLIQVAQQNGNQALYTSSWASKRRQNEIQTAINDTLQAIKDGHITGRNADKTYNFSEDVLPQTGKRYDPNSSALDYLNWLFDHEEAPADFFTQPKPKEEPKKEEPKKFTGSTVSKYFTKIGLFNPDGTLDRATYEVNDIDPKTKKLISTKNRLDEVKNYFTGLDNLITTVGDDGSRSSTWDFSDEASPFASYEDYDKAFTAIKGVENLAQLRQALSRYGIQNEDDWVRTDEAVVERPLTQAEQHQAWLNQRNAEIIRRNNEIQRVLADKEQDWYKYYSDTYAKPQNYQIYQPIQVSGNRVTNFDQLKSDISKGIINTENWGNYVDYYQAVIQQLLDKSVDVLKDSKGHYYLNDFSHQKPFYLAYDKATNKVHLKWVDDDTQVQNQLRTAWFDNERNNLETSMNNGTYTYKYYPTFKQGGVLKGEHGLISDFDIDAYNKKFEADSIARALNESTRELIESRQKAAQVDSLQEVARGIKNKNYEIAANNNASDIVGLDFSDPYLKGAMADFLGMLLSFGNNKYLDIAGGVAGLAGTGYTLVGDINNEAMRQKPWKIVGNTLKNVGFDLMGYLPNWLTANSKIDAKSKRATLAKAMPILTTILTAPGIVKTVSNPQEIINSINVAFNTPEMLTAADLQNINTAINLTAGVFKGGASYVQQRGKPTQTGTSTQVKGKKGSVEVTPDQLRQLREARDAKDYNKANDLFQDLGGTQLPYTRKSKFPYQDGYNVLTPVIDVEQVPIYDTKATPWPWFEWWNGGTKTKPVTQSGQTAKTAPEAPAAPTTNPAPVVTAAPAPAPAAAPAAPAAPVAPTTPKKTSNTKKNNHKKKKEQGGKLNQLKALRKGGILKFQPGGLFEGYKKWYTSNYGYGNVGDLDVSTFRNTDAYKQWVNSPEGKEYLENLNKSTTPYQSNWTDGELKYFNYAGIKPDQYGSVSEFRNSEEYLNYLNSNFNTNQELKTQASNAIAQTVNPSNLGSSGTGSAGTWRHVGGVKHFDGTNYTNAAMQDGLSMLAKMDPSKRQAGIEALKAAGNNTEAWNQAFNTHFGDINTNIVGYNPEKDHYDGVSTQFRQNLIKNFSQFTPEEEDSDIDPTSGEILAQINAESEALHKENPNLAAEIKALRNPKEETFEDALQTYKRNAVGKRPNVGGEDQYKKVSGLYDLAQLGIKNKAIEDYAQNMSDLYQNNIYDAQYHQDQLKNVTNWLPLRNKQEQEHAGQINMIQQMGGTDVQSNKQALLALFKQQQDDKTNLNIQEKQNIDQQIANNIDIANNNAKLRIEDSNDLQKNTLAANITSGSILAEADKAVMTNYGDYMVKQGLAEGQHVKDWNAALYANEVDKASLDYQNAVNYANLYLADDPVAWQEHVNKATNALATLQSEQRNKMYGFKTKPTGPNYAKKGGKLDSDTKIQIENSRFLSKQIIQQLKNRDKGLDRLSKITYKTILKSLGLE